MGRWRGFPKKAGKLPLHVVECCALGGGPPGRERREWARARVSQEAAVQRRPRVGLSPGCAGACGSVGSRTVPKRSRALRGSAVEPEKPTEPLAVVNEVAATK